MPDCRDRPAGGLRWSERTGGRHLFFFGAGSAWRHGGVGLGSGAVEATGIAGCGGVLALAARTALTVQDSSSHDDDDESGPLAKPRGTSFQRFDRKVCACRCRAGPVGEMRGGGTPASVGAVATPRLSESSPAADVTRRAGPEGGGGDRTPWDAWHSHLQTAIVLREAPPTVPPSQSRRM